MHQIHNLKLCLYISENKKPTPMHIMPFGFLSTYKHFKSTFVIFNPTSVTIIIIIRTNLFKIPRLYKVNITLHLAIRNQWREDPLEPSKICDGLNMPLGKKPNEPLDFNYHYLFNVPLGKEFNQPFRFWLPSPKALSPNSYNLTYPVFNLMTNLQLIKQTT